MERAGRAFDAGRRRPGTRQSNVGSSCGSRACHHISLASPRIRFPKEWSGRPSRGPLGGRPEGEGAGVPGGAGARKRCKALQGGQVLTQLTRIRSADLLYS